MKSNIFWGAAVLMVAAVLISIFGSESGEKPTLSPALLIEQQAMSGALRGNTSVAKSEPQTVLTNNFFKSIGNEKLELRAEGGLVADLISGEVYFALNSSRRWPAASLTKLMTAALTMERVPITTPVELKKDAFENVGDASTAALASGEIYSAYDALQMMMVFSSNESAEALADLEDRTGFVEEMNRKALEWGLTETHFADPTGLSSADQSTAEDLRRLGSKIYTTYPQLFEMTKRPAVRVKELRSGTVKVFSNNNKFVGRPDFLGGKTGYTEEAGGNLLTVFSYAQRPVILVILGAQDRFGETEKMFSWFKNNYSL